MVKCLIVAVAMIIACGCASVAKQASSEDEDAIKVVMNTYREAMNANDVGLLDPVLSRNFSIVGLPRNASVDLLKQVLFKGNPSSERIKAFENLVFVIEQDRSAGKVKFLKVISGEKNDRKTEEEFSFVRENGNWRLSKLFEATATVTTQNNRESKFTTLNTANMRKVSGNGYTVYFEDGLDEVAKKSLQILGEAKAIVLAALGLNELHSMDVLLTEKTNVKVETGSGRMVMAIPVKKDASIEDSQKFWEFLLWVHSHEEVEGTLVMTYGLHKPETRWYREGMADYAGYVVSGKFNPEMCKTVAGGRREGSLRHKGKGSLLDWAGTGLMGNLPSNGAGDGKVAPSGGSDADAYGASLQFFLDFVKDYGEGMLSKIHQELARTKEPDNQKLLEIMSTLTKEDIRERVLKY